MKMTRKITVGYLSLAAIIIAGGYFNAVSLRSADEGFHEVSEKSWPQIEALEKMKSACLRIVSQAMERIHDRACRYSEGYGVIMCDIDYFKKYNDMYGHIQGDNILKAIAETLKKTLRLSDEIFRYGGEEIIIILPEQDINNAMIAAERIVRCVESLRIEHKASEFGIVTISCGITAFDRKTAGVSPEFLYRLG